MAQLMRYLITDPATSRDFIEKMREALDDGTHTIPVVATQVANNEQIETQFTVHGSRIDKLVRTYSGKLDTGDIATITVHSHSDFNSTPAQLVFMHQSIQP